MENKRNNKGASLGLFIILLVSICLQSFNAVEIRAETFENYLADGFPEALQILSDLGATPSLNCAVVPYYIGDTYTQQYYINCSIMSDEPSGSQECMVQYTMDGNGGFTKNLGKCIDYIKKAIQKTEESTAGENPDDDQDSEQPNTTSLIHCETMTDGARRWGVITNRSTNEVIANIPFSCEILADYLSDPYNKLSATDIWLTDEQIEQLKSDVNTIISEHPELREDGSYVDDGMGMTEEEYRKCQSTSLVFAWFVCPLLNGLIRSSKWIYSKVEDDLRINVQLFTTGQAINEDTGEPEGDGALYKGWSAFRDITNVILVIVFIAIIISQLTGYGIDNYGIKKLLPRLVVIAIVINLSYILCQLLVDISNIVGANAYTFLRSLASVYTFSGSDKATGLVIGSLYGAIITVILVAITNVGVLVSLLLTMIGAIISIMFIFLLLGVRQAAVAIFVMIAPLAIAAKTMPNTEKLFDKWSKVFKTLLLLYPICGLMMGAGYYGSRFLMSLGGEVKEGNFMFAIVAIILLFVPIFFIPKLVKGAFDGLGKIGATLTGLGSKASKGTTGKIANSEAMKRLKTNWQANGVPGLRKPNNWLRSKMLNNDFIGKTMGMRHMYARNLAARDKMRMEDVGSMGALYAEQTKDGTSAQLIADFDAAMREGDTDKAQAIISVGQRRYGPAMAAHVAEYAAGNDLNEKQLSALSYYASTNLPFIMDLKKKAPQMADYITNNGKASESRMVDGVQINAGDRVDRNYYYGVGDDGKSLSSANKSADIVGSREAELLRALEHGGVTSVMAQGVVNSNNENTRTWFNDLSQNTQTQLRARAAEADHMAQQAQPATNTGGETHVNTGGARSQQTQSTQPPSQLVQQAPQQPREYLPDQVGGIPVGGAVNVAGGRQILLSEQSVDNMRRSQPAATGAANAQPAQRNQTTIIYGRNGRPIVDDNGRPLEVPHA